MSPPTYPIVGIPVEEGHPLPLRQEITAWANNSDNAYQVSLFLRAIANLQAKPVEDKLGYFQLAGIHSYPLVPWDGEGQSTPQHDPPGFCNHNLVTFPTWHRPYMLLYEQVLYQTMLKMISEWQIPDQERKIWTAAANQFRLPYWDWGQKQAYIEDYGIPEICTFDTWSIVEPNANGAKKPFKNPLTGFINPKKDKAGNNVPMGDKLMCKNAIHDDDTLPWSQCIGVSRYGIRSDQSSSKWSKGVNNWKFSNQGIKSPEWYGNHPKELQGSSLADAISRMFTDGYFNSWETFASTAHNDPKNTSNTNFMSLEYIHNVVHNATGGTFYSVPEVYIPEMTLGLGHMSDVPVAAFDPIFWLHHCNVDRLCAMWQALNWNKWLEKDGPTCSASLLPFHYDEHNSTWTSNRARDWRLSNYQYDDMKNMPSGPPTHEFQDSLRRHIHGLYLSTSSAVSPMGYTLDNNTFNDYIINVVYDRYALNGRAYSILFYIGTPTMDFSAAKSDENFVASVYTFSAPLASPDGRRACDNCGKQQAAKVLSKAQIPLTLPLLRRVEPIKFGFGEIPGTQLGLLEPEKVEKVLKFGLNWYFVALGGEQVDASEFPRTEIAVLQGKGRHPEGDHIMPRYEGYTKLTDATKDKALGFGNDMGPNHLIGDD